MIIWRLANYNNPACWMLRLFEFEQKVLMLVINWNIVLYPIEITQMYEQSRYIWILLTSTHVITVARLWLWKLCLFFLTHVCSDARITRTQLDFATHLMKERFFFYFQNKNLVYCKECRKSGENPPIKAKAFLWVGKVMIAIFWACGEITLLHYHVNDQQSMQNFIF